jgi:hypothetical protein
MGPSLHATQFEPRAHSVQRLALLLGEKPGQLFGMLADLFPRGVAKRPAFGVGYFRPFRKRGVGGSDRVIEIGRAGLAVGAEPTTAPVDGLRTSK